MNTIMDNYQWINIHVYVMKDWCQVPILLTLECVNVSANANNITTILLKCVIKYGEFSNEECGSRWVCLHCDKDFVLKGYCIWVISQLKSKFFFY